MSVSKSRLPEIYRRLGMNIKRLRVVKQINQEQLGLAVGLSRTSITNIELGNQRLHIETLAMIASELDADVVELLAPIQLDQLPVEVLVGGVPVTIDALTIAKIQSQFQKETSDES